MNHREKATNFIREYVQLCQKYQAEVVVNAHGVHMAALDNGESFTFSSVFPEWDEEVETQEEGKNEPNLS